MSAPQPTAIADQPPRHLATLLTNHPLFSALPVAALNHFADKSQMVSFEKGQTVFLQSEEADWFYLILSGWLKIYREF